MMSRQEGELFADSDLVGAFRVMNFFAGRKLTEENFDKVLHTTYRQGRDLDSRDWQVQLFRTTLDCISQLDQLEPDLDAVSGPLRHLPLVEQQILALALFASLPPDSIGAVLDLSKSDVLRYQRQGLGQMVGGRTGKG